MNTPRWLEAGAHAPTALATFVSFAAAPVSGLGAMTLLFGGFWAGSAMLASGAGLWLVGRKLDRR